MTKIRHLRLGKRAITLAYKRENNLVYYSYAICSNKDQFCRKTGRELAVKRLNEGFTYMDTVKDSTALYILFHILLENDFNVKIENFLFSVVDAVLWGRL